ncbi:MAG: hypothetical protein ACOX7N_07000 [Lawsonibacter sp.]
MAMEAIEKVTRTEEQTKQRREAALTESKQKILVAQRAAQRVLEDARTEAEGEVRQQMAQAEEQAAQEAKVVLAQAEENCRKMKQAARERLEQAAELIVEKVVNR